MGMLQGATLNFRRPLRVIGIIEALILFTSTYFGAHARFLGDWGVIHESIGPILPRALAFTTIMLLAMSASGLYHPQLRDRMSGVGLRLLISVAVGAVALAVLYYVFPELYLGRGALGLSFLFAIPLLATVRWTFMRTQQGNLFKRNVLVLGAGPGAVNFLRLRRRSDRRAFRIVGFVPVPGEPQSIAAGLCVHPAEALCTYARDQGIHEIVVAVSERRGGLPLQDLLECKMNGIAVVDVVTFFERETGRLMLDLLSPGWLVFSGGFSATAWRRLSERVFDVLASMLLLVLSSPLMLLAAAALLVESRGRAPVLYRQTRVGLYGAQFEVLKFRSMCADAECDGKARWAQKGDPRITRVGAILRRYRVDELPQLINILRGEMSFVGPRPERPEFVSELTTRIRYYSERHRVKPGLAGWAQLCYPYGASEEDAGRKLEYDLYYVKNHSLILDCAILLQTLEVVLFGKGAR